MNYVRAGWNWARLAGKAAVYGTTSVSLGGLPGGRNVSQWCMRRWCASSTRTFGIEHHLEGAENLALAPQAILVANHQSSLDILVLGAELRRDYRWLAKAELFKVPFSGWHLQFAGHVPVYRGEAKEKNSGIDARIHSVVEEGASVLLFPEGSRSTDGKLRRFRSGAFRFAVNESLPVLPLVIRGTANMMKAGAIDIDVNADRRASIKVLPPIKPRLDLPMDEAVNSLRDQCWQAMAEELGEDMVSPEALKAPQTAA